MTDETFAALKPVFQPFVDKLVAEPPALPRELPKGKGLYALREKGIWLYVGITSNLRQRWQMHRNGDPSAASFAVRLARIDADRPRTYKKGDGLKALMASDDAFRKAFTDARNRIRGMEIRYVEWPGEDDELAILEIYAAKALETGTHNDFATH